MFLEETIAKELADLVRREIATATRPLLERIAELEFQVRSMRAKEYAASDAATWPGARPGIKTKSGNEKHVQ
jgi:hypothetical protein